MAIFLPRKMLNHSIRSDSRTERGVAFNGVLIFDDFLPHSADAFSISARCLTIVANVDVEISRRSAKAFCGPTFLSNSRKMLSFSLNEKRFRFRQPAICFTKSKSKIKISSKSKFQKSNVLQNRASKTCVVEWGEIRKEFPVLFETHVTGYTHDSLLDL